MIGELSDTRRWEKGGWEKAALAAAVIILLSPLLYLFFHSPEKSRSNGTEVRFVGSEKCKGLP